MSLIAVVDSFTKPYRPPSKAKTIEKQNSAAKRISEVCIIGPLFSLFHVSYQYNMNITLLKKGEEQQK